MHPSRGRGRGGHSFYNACSEEDDPGGGSSSSRHYPRGGERERERERERAPYQSSSSSFNPHRGSYGRRGGGGGGRGRGGGGGGGGGRRGGAGAGAGRHYSQPGWDWPQPSPSAPEVFPLPPFHPPPVARAYGYGPHLGFDRGRRQNRGSFRPAGRPEDSAIAQIPPSPPPPLPLSPPPPLITTEILSQSFSSLSVASDSLTGSVLLPNSELNAPPRPGFGTKGRTVMLRANHFLVDLECSVISQYNVEITPLVSSKVIARAIEEQLICTNRAELEGKLPVYDGSKSMYIVGPPIFEQKEFDITLTDDRGGGGEGPIRKKTYKVVIRPVSVLSRKSLDEFLKGREPMLIPLDFLQGLDIALRENPSRNFIPVSRSFYNKELGSRLLPGGLIGLNGFYQSLRPTAQGLALNVDLSTSAFHEGVSVIEYLRKKLRRFNPNAGLSEGDRMKVKRALIRLKVEVTHRPTPRRYRIAGLSSSPTRELKFPFEEGREIRVVDYFRETYNYNIRYPELPCLQLQASKASYLPMEVCRICEGQKFIGRLSDAQMCELQRLACQKPREREGNIRRIMGRPDGPGRGDHCAEFGLQVSPYMTEVKGRVLPEPKLRYGEGGKVKEVTPHMGKWNLLDSHVVEGGKAPYWAVVSFDNWMTSRSLEAFVEKLSKRCVELGVGLAEDNVIPPQYFRQEDLESPSRLEQLLKSTHERALQVIRTMEQQEGGYLQLLVCVMGEKHSSYGELKRICETDIGLVTQCCLSRHVLKCNSQYLANLALKINAKVGGRNVTLARGLPSLCPKVFGRPTIIFGADVTHPHPGDDSGPSIAAIVANMDWPSANRYIARVRAQAHRSEIIDSAHLKKMVQELWLEFRLKVGVVPEKVVFFRDGVSEGQFEFVLQCEVVALKEALREVGGPDYHPLITWAVVQKRHHTRLFPTDNTNIDNSGNILPGTVVDTAITHPREFDFYLCSHAGMQGTSRPTHYHVLWDENHFGPDDLQGVVYNLCYTYVRCTRSVSIVPPAYYAHLAAYRARLYVDSAGSGSDTASLRGAAAFSGGKSFNIGNPSSRAGPQSVRELPPIRPIVQEVMYYC